MFNVYPLPAWLVNGSYLRLDCQAFSDPPANIYWLLNFEEINITTLDCNGVGLVTDTVLCSNGSLIIPEVDFSDTGFYTCVADNDFGVNQVSVSVDVGVLIEENIGECIQLGTHINNKSSFQKDPSHDQF